MYILGKRADMIDAEDIRRLVDNKITENKSLDYKRELKITQDKERKEFLFDIASMYNTDGGCLVYGIDESKDDKGQNTGIPQSLLGISIDNQDKLIQQIEDIVKGNTEPSISGLVVRPITIEGLSVLVIGIPKGLSLPSMVTFNETNKFYRRRSSGKYPVDVYELNQMFMQNQIIRERAEKFRNDRTEKVLAQKVYPNLNISSSVFVQVIPFSFLQDEILDVSNFETLQIHRMMPPMQNVGGWSQMFNLDGFATLSSNGQQVYSYDQIFRNGIYEAYTSIFFWQDPQKGNINCTSSEIIPIIRGKIKDILLVLKELKIEGPFIICISLHNIKNGVITTARGSSKSFMTNEILLPALVLPTFETDLRNLLKPVFDILWQSVGISSSPVETTNL